MLNKISFYLTLDWSKVPVNPLRWSCPSCYFQRKRVCTCAPSSRNLQNRRNDIRQTPISRRVSHAGRFVQDSRGGIRYSPYGQGTSRQTLADAFSVTLADLQHLDAVERAYREDLVNISPSDLAAINDVERHYDDVLEQEREEKIAAKYEAKAAKDYLEDKFNRMIVRNEEGLYDVSPQFYQQEDYTDVQPSRIQTMLNEQAALGNPNTWSDDDD